MLASKTLFTTFLSHKKRGCGTGPKYNLLVQDKSANSPPLSLRAVWPHRSWILGTGPTLHWLPNHFCRLFGRVLVSWRKNCMRDHSKTCTKETNHIPGSGYNFWQFSGTVQFTITYSAFKYFEWKVICPVTAINPHIRRPFILLQAVSLSHAGSRKT